MARGATDLGSLMRDTVREATRSWRLPVTIALGAGLGAFEWMRTRDGASLAFGPVAAVYTLLLGPLPWRALAPLEADGERARKFVRGVAAAAIALALFALLAGIYVLVARAGGSGIAAREFTVTALLFMVGGWGLARDVQLEQRLDRSLERHGQLRAELEEARLYAIRADLDPHFLFNALNAIASQCVSNPAAAEENVVRLSSLLRAVLDTRRRTLHALEEEVALARDYLGLLAARFPALKYAVDIDPAAASRMVPPLLLQPLLENAVRHGRIQEGEISLSARVGPDGILELRVRSPGCMGVTREGGIGLELVRRRVEMAWGSADAFAIADDGRETTAVIRVQASASPDANNERKADAA